MQINLPIEPTLPSPAPAPVAPASVHGETKPSFEHCLGKSEPAPAVKKPGALAAAPAKAAAKRHDLPMTKADEAATTKATTAKAAPDSPQNEEAATAGDKTDAKPPEIDPNVAATLAACSLVPPLLLPPPPVAVGATTDPAPEATAVEPVALLAEPVVTSGYAAAALPGKLASSVETPADATATVVASAAPATQVEQPVEKAATLPPDTKPEKTRPEDAPAEEAAPVISTALSLPREKRGTPAAMDRGTMSNALLNRQVKAKAAGITAAVEKAPTFATASRPAAAAPSVTPAAVKPIAAATENLSATDAAPVAEPAAPTAQGTPAASAAEPATKAERVAHDVNLTLDHVERMTETLHTNGRQQIEMEVKLHDDSRVTISLQMERGELKTTFKTDSTELRDALAQNWGQVTDKNSDRSIRLNPPVFESSDARHGFSGDSRQQARDGRAYTQAETESSSFAFRPPVKTSSPAAAQTSAASSGLELYA